jgi:hypothetical protein
MRIAVVTGSRELEHHGTVEGPLINFNPWLVMHGACGIDLSDWDDSLPNDELAKRMRGADRFAHEYVDTWGLPYLAFPAAFNSLGPKAGPIRNRDMIQNAATLTRYGHEVVVFAFPRGASPGTRGCVREAVRAGLDVRVVEG